MRIEKLAFGDGTGWRLEEMEFFPELTLLVGVSGVGKTKVLRAIETLRQIAEGDCFPGVHWDVTFSAAGQRYQWQGAFHKDAGEESPRILRERLLCDADLIIDRDDNIRLRGQKTPKLAVAQSALALLSNEVPAASQGWGQILSFTDELRMGLDRMGHRLSGPAYYDVSTYHRDCQRYQTLESIQQAHLTTAKKMALLSKAAPDAFQSLITQYQEIFEQVEQVRFNQQIDSVALELKERGCTSWIPAEELSSGMLRTLYHLARMMLWPDGTVVLIDEFENSLGVNCLDVITQDLHQHARRLQFIITSHHPYIINNIRQHHWKILSRQGSVVRAHNAADLGLGRSHHEAFIQLMNHEDYREGVRSP